MSTVTNSVLQQTLNEPISAIGVGLHCGRRVRLTMRPAPPDTGIVFHRIDLSPPVSLAAAPLAVGDTRMATSLVKDGVNLSTIEHLMSALWGVGIDNLHVDVDAPEIPILDGSSAPFVFLLQSAGIVKQPKPRLYVKVLKTVEVVDGEKCARLSPHDGFRLNFTIAFHHPVFRQVPRRVDLEMTQDVYLSEVAQARTFGFAREVAAMRAHGLALGGGLNNAIVVGDHRILNSEGLRLPDEFVRHKVLDAIGDLYVLGRRIIGAFSAERSGHALNNALLRALLADPASWVLVEKTATPLPLRTAA